MRMESVVLNIHNSIPFHQFQQAQFTFYIPETSDPDQELFFFSPNYSKGALPSSPIFQYSSAIIPSSMFDFLLDMDSSWLSQF